MTKVEAQHEIEKLQGMLSFTEDERKGLALDKKQLTKELSEAQLYIKRLKHEKEILLAALEAEIEKRIEFQSKLFFFEEDSKELPF